MASENSNPVNESPVAEVSPDQVNGSTNAVEEGTEPIDDAPFSIKVVLPQDGKEPTEFEIPVSPLEQIHEIRQSIIENPLAVQYSCFHLEHNSKALNDFVPVSETTLEAGAELHVVEDPYTEKEARIHLIRVRELIGAAGDRTDTVHGLLAGASVYDDVVAKAQEPIADTEEGKQLPPYDFEAQPSLDLLVPADIGTAPKTVKSISLSPWNPPTPQYRQRGHLLYLIVSTNEGEQFQITSHVGGFYVNKCSNQKFDPEKKTSPRQFEARSLFTLLGMISASFEKNYQEFQEFAVRRDALSSFQIGNTLPSAPWLVPSPESSRCAHSSDPARSQETYLLAGAENTDSLRDWNEEFQSSRELPKDTIQDRVFRERLISKLFADYTDAAARGAVLVARGEVAPLNPTEEPDAQIFVYNNVFFSYGADGVGTFTSEGGDEAARVATGKDVLGVKLVNQLDIDGLYTPGTVVVDYLGKRIVGQSIVPGIFKQPEPGETQIHYGAVDGKDHVAADERFAASFATLAKALRVKKHAVWDKESKRFELEGSVEMKGLLGTDGRKYVLDLYRITPLDIAWMDEDESRPEDSKYPHRMTVLRPELVEALGKSKARDFVRAELARRQEINKAKESSDEAKEGEQAKTEAEGESDRPTEKDDKAEKDEKKDEEKADQVDRIDMGGFKFALNPDVFSGQDPQTEEEKAEWAKDEEDVREACKYLRETVMTELIKELADSDISFPMDGRSLSKLLHRRGINIRYLGYLAELCDKADEKIRSHLQCFRNLCEREMVVRAFKHIAAKYLKSLPLPLTSSCLAHLLNCLLGTGLNPKPVAKVDDSLKDIYKSADLSFEAVTPESLRENIEKETVRRYRFDLGKEWFAQIRPIQLLREIALTLGLQIQKKDFTFVAPREAIPVANGNAEAEPKAAELKKKKSKKARDGSPASIASTTPPHTFSPDDIVNIVPVVKDSAPRSQLAEEALEGGRLSVFQGQRKLGEELLLESLSLYEQIYGLVHPEVAQMYHSLSQVYYGLEQKDAAVELARKAAIVAERTMGIDSAETVLNYLNLSLFLHQHGESHQALVYARHALDLWKVIYGHDHPDTITTMNNYAVMLQSVKDYHESRRWFEESLRVCDMVFGRESVNSATLLFQLAQALALDGDYKDAVNKMRESYNIFKSTLGPQDKNTLEAEHWFAQLTSNAVSMEKQTKAARNAFANAAKSRLLSFGTVQPTKPKNPKSNTDDRDINSLVKYIEEGDKKGNSRGGKKKGGPVNPKRRGGKS
ncbi:hypothetical protein OQA88_511 [Cercophora sp. LCS_1]